LRRLVPIEAANSLENCTIFYVQVVKLASETFNYPRIDIEKSKAKKIVLEHFPKVRIVLKNVHQCYGKVRF
jgi:hypothetical protein